MARKYGKNDTTRNNVLTLVEALLALADEEITVPGDKLKVIPKVEWVKEDELLVSGKIQQKRNRRTQTDEKGITKDDLWVLVECCRKTLELSKPKDEAKIDYAQQKAAVQDILDCLKDLEILIPKTSAKNQGYWKFHLKLKHQTAEKKDNLQVIKDLWANKFGQVTDSQPATPGEKPIEWRQICTNLLDAEAQRHQATGYGMGHEVNIYVPLGLVKPKQQPRRGGEDADPIRGMQQYQLQGEKEIEKRYAYQEFLNQVIAKADKNLAIIGEPGAGKTTWLQQIVRYLTSTPLEKDQGFEKDQGQTGIKVPLSKGDLGGCDRDGGSQSNMDVHHSLEKEIPPTPLKKGGSCTPLTNAIGRGDSVIWIPLANLGEFTLEEYLLNRWLKDAFPNQLEPTAEQKQALVDLFNSGKVWLLLDGVDEMKTANPLTQISQSLTGWVKQARVVLTCRLNVWEANPNTLPEFDTYRTLCFAGEQVHDFITQWFGKTEKPELGQQLQGKLAEAESARIFDLVKNPLRLSLLCKAWKINPGTLPTTQAKLYQQFRDDFYLWKQQQFPTSLSQQQELNRRLGQLAFRAIDEKSPLRQSLVYAVLSEEWFELAEKLGWLNLVYRDVRTDEPIYAWFHLTFQEYFAALAVDDWDYFLPRTHVDRPVEGKEYRIFQPQWKQVILLWLGCGDIADEKEEFIQALVNFNDGCGQWNFEQTDRGFYEHRAYFLAAAGISEFKTCSLGDAIVKQIVQWEFGYYNQEKQEWWRTFLDPIEEDARETLPETDRKRAIQELGQIVEHPQCDEDTRSEAAKSLWEIDPGNKRAIDELVKVLDTTQNESTLRQVADSLGKIYPGNQTAIDALVRILGTTEDKDTRWRATDSLAEIGQGNQTAIAALVKIIETTEHEHIRMQAASSLGKIDPGNQKAIAALVKVIENTEDEDTRMQAVSSLGKIGQGNEIAIAALVRVIETSKDKDTRWLAAYSLGKIGQGNETAIAALVRILETTEDEYTRMLAAESLGKIGQGNETAIALLVKVIETTEDEYTRRQAAESLEKIITTDENRKTVVTALQPYLNHETYENNFDLLKKCYQVLWNIAQDLPYPDFYRAWHGLTATSPLGAKNLAQLPQNLQAQLTKTNLNQTRQLFCIDGSKFIGDDPAKTIYRQMTQQGGHKITDQPKNMADLQDYWADLIDENDKHPVLIFYQCPSKSNSQGFRETFLDMLARFDGIICLITDQTYPGLKTFSPQDPQLIDNIIAWLQDEKPGFYGGSQR